LSEHGHQVIDGSARRDSSSDAYDVADGTVLVSADVTSPVAVAVDGGAAGATRATWPSGVAQHMSQHVVERYPHVTHASLDTTGAVRQDWHRTIFGDRSS
jgi:urate oxidase